MSVGAMCLASSGRNGGCWRVLVFPRLFFGGGNGVFFPIRDLRQKKSLRDLNQKKKFRRKKNRNLRQKKKLRDLRQNNKIKKRLTLISTIELRFPPVVGAVRIVRSHLGCIPNCSEVPGGGGGGCPSADNTPAQRKTPLNPPPNPPFFYILL